MAGKEAAAPEREHVHVFIHVASTGWDGKPCLVCRCTCGKTLTPDEIIIMRAAAGVA
jgi:hypothetical protein